MIENDTIELLKELNILFDEEKRRGTCKTS